MRKKSTHLRQANVYRTPTAYSRKSYARRLNVGIKVETNLHSMKMSMGGDNDRRLLRVAVKQKKKKKKRNHRHDDKLQWRESQFYIQRKIKEKSSLIFTTQKVQFDKRWLNSSIEFSTIIVARSSPLPASKFIPADLLRTAITPFIHLSSRTQLQ